MAYLRTRGIRQVGAIGWSMGAATLLNAAPEQPEIKAIVAKLFVFQPFCR